MRLAALNGLPPHVSTRNSTKGTKAPQAAGKIHSDFERGFIRASVIGYDDLEANNFDSVSYTHLDVYKRQSPTSCTMRDTPSARVKTAFCAKIASSA